MICLKGIDVSKWQGDINWLKVKNDGVQFAILRAGYSTTIDSKFIQNIEGCIKNNIPVGVYWFSYAYDNSTLKKEYEKCIEVLKPYKNKIKYPVFFDFEYDSLNYAKKKGVTINKNIVSNFTKTFLNQVEKEGYKVGVYTNLDFSKNYFNDDILNKYDVWIAQYNNTCSYKGKYTLWQYSEKGKVNGVNGNVDMNYCYKNYISNVNESLKLIQQAINTSYQAGLVVDGIWGVKTESQIKIHYLKRTMKNEHVRVIQTLLKQIGYNIAVDGSYGPATEKVVMDFQKQKGLKVDGYCGVETHKAIIKELG